MSEATPQSFNERLSGPSEASQALIQESVRGEQNYDEAGNTPPKRRTELGGRTRSYSREDKMHESYAGMMQTIDDSRKEGFSEK